MKMQDWNLTERTVAGYLHVLQRFDDIRGWQYRQWMMWIDLLGIVISALDGQTDGQER